MITTNTINPLKEIAQAVNLASKDKKHPRIWHKKSETYRYSSFPMPSEKSMWSEMSTWKTMLAIEDKIADGNYLSTSSAEHFKLTSNELKALRVYCTGIAAKESGYLTSSLSFLKHGIKGQGWMSSGSKASKLIGRIRKIEAKNLYPKKYDFAYEYTHKGPSGRSRIFDLEENNFRNLSEQKRGIGFINGIMNNFDEAKSSLDLFSALGNVKIRGVYNATHGLFADLKECWYGWYGHSTRPSRKVIKLWDEFFDKHQIDGKDDPDAKFLMIAHSQGAIHVKNALKAYSPERRQRIYVMLVAPGVYPNSKLCADMVVYRVYWDFVTWFDFKAGERNAKDKIIQLKPDKKEHYIDHVVQSKTYRPFIQKHLNAFAAEGTLWTKADPAPVAPVKKSKHKN